MTPLPFSAHQTFKKIIPGLEEAIKATVENIPDKNRIIHPEETNKFHHVNALLKNYVTELTLEGYTWDEAVEHAHLLWSNIFWMINFEVNGKIFYLIDKDASLSFLKDRPNVNGKDLKLPSPSCAFAFIDRPTLALAERLLDKDADCEIKGRELKTFSAYLMEFPEFYPDKKEYTLLSVNLLFDSQEGEWPFLLSRSLYLKSSDHVENIIASCCPDLEEKDRDPIFIQDEMKQLIWCVFNAILYIKKNDFS